MPEFLYQKKNASKKRGGLPLPLGAGQQPAGAACRSGNLSESATKWWEQSEPAEGKK